MSDATLDAAAGVDLILRRSGLRVTDEERGRLVGIYPVLQDLAEQMRLAETRRAEPAVVYPAVAKD
jgi:hypothetical protein